MLKYVAEEIAVVASNITGYAIIITDEKGIVIGAASDSENRLGTLHEASLKVISSGRQMTHNQADVRVLRGTYPGITMPIMIEEEVVGTIGIRGDSEVVERFGQLVKYIAEIMLKDRIGAESAHIKHQNLQMLCTMIITYQGDSRSRDAILNQGLMLGFSLLIPRRAVIINRINKKPNAGVPDNDLYSTQVYKEIKAKFPNQQNIITALSAGEENYLVFALDENGDTEKKVKELYEKLRTESGIEIKAGIGGAGSDVEDLKNSFKEAERVIQAAQMGMTEDVASIEAIHLEELILEIAEKTDSDSFNKDIARILKDKNAEEIMEVIEAWCESEFNIARTARMLNLHKNTLLYRFEKIEEILGIDYKDFKHILACYLEIKVYRVRNRKNTRNIV